MADDDELVLFTWENMFPQEVLDGFTEETGIKVVYSNFDTDETMLVGWITNERSKLSKAAETYLDKLKSVVSDHGYKLID